MSKTGEKHLFYQRYGKRALDITLSLIFILLFWWVFVIISLVVRKKMGSPVMYLSQRMGKGEQPFKLYKYRSMTNERDENGVLLPGAQRLTRFGRKLRSTSLDELPSLINILKGEMSIVGPRPLLMKYQPYYYEHERVRHTVRPGLTGWAQVNGRNAVSWDDKFKMDIYYVENMSLWLDLKVIFLTFYKVIRRADIIQGDQATGSLYVVRAHMTPKEGVPPTVEVK